MCPTCTLVLIDTFVQLIHRRASGVMELPVVGARKTERQEILPTLSGRRKDVERQDSHLWAREFGGGLQDTRLLDP
jgi:hypothetical protein